MSAFGKILAATKSLIVRKKGQMLLDVRQEDELEKGLFIIETGKCSICND